MRKSTLTVMLGLVVLFGVAIIAFPKLNSESKTISKEQTRFEVKTKKTNRENPAEKEDGEFITVSFGVNASFDKPEGFTEPVK